MKKSNSGYTLYELIAVLVIIGIIVSLALPIMYVKLIEHNLNTTYLQLQALLRYGQDEAMRRGGGGQVLICPASFNVNQILNSSNCTGNDGIWNSGGIVFIDADNDQSYSSGERILATRFDEQVEISMSYNSNPINMLQLNSDGQISNIATTGNIVVTFSETKYGICRASSYNLNMYGSLTTIAENQGCS